MSEQLTFSEHNVEARFRKDLPRLLKPLKVLKTKFPQGVDIVAEVVTPSGKKQTIMIETKSVGFPSNIRQAVRGLKAAASTRAYPLFASSFIGPQGREICREEGVGYLDLAGNVFLDLPGYYVEKAVDKNPFPQKGRPKSLFSPVSTRIIRAFLEEPDRCWKVRELVPAMGVSLGQTSKIVRQLVALGYLVKDSKGYKLNQASNLLDDWKSQYAPNANKRVAYYSFEQNPERLMKQIAARGSENKLRYACTSFAAASQIAPFVRGVTTVQCYVNASEVDEWIKVLDLRPVEAGANVILVFPYDNGVFYRTQTINGISLVSNVQLYLDLYSDPARGREQAEFLRKEKLKI